MKSIKIVVLLVIVALVFSYCGKKETPEQKAQREAAEAMQKMAKAFGAPSSQGGNSGNPFAEMQKATQKMKEQSEAMQGGKIIVAERDTLLAALPEVSGWKAENPKYSKGSFGNVESSNISVDYGNDSNEKVEVKIVDTATMSSMLAPLKMIIGMNISNEDDKRYEKVTQLNGMPAIEKLNKESGRAEITLIVKDRFIVTLETRAKGSVKLLQEFAAKMNLSKL